MTPLGAGESVPTGCSGTLTLAQGGARTIKALASEDFTDHWLRTITDSGTGTANVNVTALAPGDYIVSLTPSGLATDFVPPGAANINVDVQSGNGSILLTGQVIGATGPTSTSWTMTSNSGSATCGPSSPLSQLDYTNATCSFTPLLSGQSATYLITMNTNQNGNPYATSMILAKFTFPVQ